MSTTDDKTTRGERLGRYLPWAAIAAAILILGVLFWTGALQLSPEVGETVHVSFNCAESVVWLIAGAYCAWRAQRSSGGLRRLFWIAAVAYGAFGVSDLVETRTGAWFDPWWLLVWKAACVACLLACLAVYVRRYRDARTTRRP